MDFQQVNINGIEVKIPAYYQQVKSLPDDPPGSCAYAFQTRHASCLLLLRTIQKNEAIPHEKEELISGVRHYLKDNQGLIQVEAGPGYAFSIERCDESEESTDG